MWGGGGGGRDGGRDGGGEMVRIVDDINVIFGAVDNVIFLPYTELTGSGKQAFMVASLISIV